MIISIHDIWQDAVVRHTGFLTEVIDAGLESLGNGAFERKIYQFIIENRQVITSGAPSSLLAVIDNYEFLFGCHILRECACERLKEIFDFPRFSLKSNKAWTAYDLCQQAKYQVCSYCQLVATGTSLPDEEVKGYRPPIDHYYAKGEYPFLALTLANFIPCCEKCNGSQMKGVIDFSENTHLNPLIDKESIGFVLESIQPLGEAAAETITLNLPKEEYRLALRVTDNHAAAYASIKTFQLDNRYKEYSGQAYHLAKKMRGLSARLNMHREALECETSIDDYLEFEPDEYRTVPHGKARICIAKQFGALPK